MLKIFKNLMMLGSLSAAFLLFGCQTNTQTNTNVNVTKTEPTEPAKTVQTHKDKEFTTKQGMVRTDGKDSTILSLNEETGDVTGFCFTNDSEIGRSIAEACKKGDLCEFSGEVDWTEKNCRGGEAFTTQARILSVKAVKKIVNK